MVHNFIHFFFPVLYNIGFLLSELERGGDNPSSNAYDLLRKDFK